MTNVNESQSASNFAAQSGRNSVDKKDLSSWYEAMAGAWGKTLDGQATKITEMAETIASGENNPSNMTMLTAYSLEMQFMSNNASTSITSVGQALESLARK